MEYSYSVTSILLLIIRCSCFLWNFSGIKGISVLMVSQGNFSTVRKRQRNCSFFASSFTILQKRVSCKEQLAKREKSFASFREKHPAIDTNIYKYQRFVILKIKKLSSLTIDCFFFIFLIINSLLIKIIFKHAWIILQVQFQYKFSRTIITIGKLKISSEQLIAESVFQTILHQRAPPSEDLKHTKPWIAQRRRESAKTLPFI